MRRSAGWGGCLVVAEGLGVADVRTWVVTRTSGVETRVSADDWVAGGNCLVLTIEGRLVAAFATGDWSMIAPEESNPFMDATRAVAGGVG